MVLMNEAIVIRGLFQQCDTISELVCCLPVLQNGSITEDDFAKSVADDTMAKFFEFVRSDLSVNWQLIFMSTNRRLYLE